MRSCDAYVFNYKINLLYKDREFSTHLFIKPLLLSALESFICVIKLLRWDLFLLLGMQF